MKIAVTHYHSTIIGGAEHAVSASILELVEQQHEVIFIHEDDGGTAQPVAPPGLVKTFRISDETEASVLKHLADWKPDIIFNHGLHGAHHLQAMLPIATTVSYIHDYLGACISGSKLHRLPQPSLCQREFGPACLLHYLPRRCGGKNPVTMLKLFNHNDAMRRVLMQNDSIVVASEHMALEWRKLGYPAERLHVVSPYCGEPPADIEPMRYLGRLAPARGEPVRLCYLGRMEPLKGGSTFIDALPLVQKALAAPVHVTMAGDGRSRLDWLAQAERVTAAHPGLSIDFPGLINAQQRSEMLSTVHALVMPSVWPEPFGQVGVQALMNGTPAVAFNSGGASDWLQHGVNGLLADSDPPNARNLARTIVDLFADPNRYRRMSAAATRTTGRFARPVHFLKLDNAFRSALAIRGVTPA